MEAGLYIPAQTQTQSSLAELRSTTENNRNEQYLGSSSHLHCHPNGYICTLIEGGRFDRAIREHLQIQRPGRSREHRPKLRSRSSSKHIHQNNYQTNLHHIIKLAA
jgi:hypothetical protein